MAFTFSAWYEQNKQKLSEKRKALYREDPEYRKKVLAASAARRKSKATSPKTGIDVATACDLIGVSMWTLNRWKNEGYLPVQTLRGHRFTQAQIELLGLLKQFFEQYPRKVAANHRDELSDLVNLIHHNWNS
jgi:hypothetical protein